MIVEIKKKNEKNSQELFNVRSIRVSTNSFIVRQLGSQEKKFSFKNYELINVERVNEINRC